MNAENLVFTVLKEIVPKGKRKKITTDALLRDELGMDSISFLSFAIALEEKSGFSILEVLAEIDIGKIVLVNDVIVLLTDYIQKNKK